VQPILFYGYLITVLLTLPRTTAAAASSSSSTSSSSSSSSSKLQADAAAFTSAVTSALSQFETGMDDDLNGPRAAAGLFALIKIGEKVVNCFLQLAALMFSANYYTNFLDLHIRILNYSIGYVYLRKQAQPFQLPALWPRVSIYTSHCVRPLYQFNITAHASNHLVPVALVDACKLHIVYFPNTAEHCCVQ
jgi:hypothetical protein